ncbi:type II and III secretion system protein family protein [Sphingomonas astaxanthinifaciens]|uniref:type II and III secretion system protein family protein n=1 Tax=Sphingomonas astaxanthinifaciens TaxID=407019 RepID=UPI000AD3B9F6|nr:type II and III secretion system protein family protein [Sphingomonas astaxanthinifaciens]
MAGKRKAVLAALALGATALTAGLGSPGVAHAQRVVSETDAVHAGELNVPVNKSQVLRVDRPYAKALIGNPEIADVLPLTDQSIYVLGKKLGTTSLTLYDRSNSLIAVMDVAVGPDVIGLKKQLSELIPGDRVGARMSNDSIVLEGIVSNAVAANRAAQIAETYAPGKVVNLLSIGSAQQVMLEVKFSEVKRSALKQLGAGFFVGSDGGKFSGAIGGGAGVVGSGPPTLGAITDSFGVLTRTFRAFGTNFEATFDALERKGAITTLAEPTLIALSGETASFLAGGEFPIPVAQGNGGGSGVGAGSGAISIEFKPFGVSLAFTPTVLADGVINLLVEPEVSSIDNSASIVVNNLRIPGLQTRRAKTTVELRDGESFAMAGLLRKDFSSTVRQFPLLGNIPIIGTLFRSTSFNRDETELVIIVTPRLVRPVRPDQLAAPTDRVKGPADADILLLGRTDTGVPPVAPISGATPRPAAPGAATTTGAATAPAATAPTGLEKDYGHVL